MKYLDEFRRKETAKKLSEDIKHAAGDQKMTFMEVCGTHTMSIARHGIRDLLPQSISLISGPGCPVCVTSNHTVDTAIALSRQPDIIVTTFGDMLKVPGSSSSLDREHARGGDIRVVASTLDALAIAEKNPDKKVVFLGVGFETTVPTIAASIIEADERKIENYYVLAAHKTMPLAMTALSTGDVKINGYICPGHVSTIIGTQFYEPLAKEFGIACVVAGFEPLDMLQGILMLVRQVVENNPKVEIQYTRVVKPEGNPSAVQIIDQVFEPSDAQWRGLGLIPGSGLQIKKKYAKYDAAIQIPIEVEPTKEPKGCLCGQILQGKVIPPQCKHFGKTCTPGNPVGSWIVSSEGTCAAYFKYNVQS